MFVQPYGHCVSHPGIEHAAKAQQSHYLIATFVTYTPGEREPSSTCMHYSTCVRVTACICLLQEKMVLGGAARNRMLIKGGSSFNALVRALKQDVVTGAAPTTTANERLMYEVDKVLRSWSWQQHVPHAY